MGILDLQSEAAGLVGPRGLLEATIASTPAALNEPVRVRFSSHDARMPIGKCYWMPRGGVWPEVGDRCLVSIDDAGNHWVVAWTSGDASDPTRTDARTPLPHQSSHSLGGSDRLLAGFDISQMQGPWRTTVPGPTDGIPFEFPISGYWMMWFSASAYRTPEQGGGIGSVRNYVSHLDAGGARIVNWARTVQLYFNLTNVHMTLIPQAAVYYVTAGTGYLSFMDSGTTSSPEDFGCATFTRVG